MYTEEQYLAISGIQHFVFCKRQWGLIHIDGLWEENVKTIEGALIHEKAHDSTKAESRGDIIITRSLNISSKTLGIVGQCDVVEFRKQKDYGITLRGKEGVWLPYPIEYKRGIPKEDLSDALQLCAQAVCLEEMLCCNISEGAIFYNETKRRYKILFSEDLRNTLKNVLLEMHQYMNRGNVPKSKYKQHCKNCSLQNLCLPKMLISNKCVQDYIDKMSEGE